MLFPPVCATQAQGKVVRNTGARGYMKAVVEKSFLERFKFIERLIARKKIGMALERLDECVPTSSTEKRIMLHVLGKAHSEMNDLEQAKKHFINALSLGENLRIWRDLSCLYYQTGDLSLWRQTYRKMKDRFEKFAPKVSAQLRFECQIILAKFLEEEGDVGGALMFYQDALKVAHALDVRDMYYSCLPQLVRIKSMFGSLEGLPELYAELITLTDNDFDGADNFDLQHSLMLAEVALFGTDSARERVESTLHSPLLKPEDKRILLYDFIEELLLHKKPVPESLQEFAGLFHDRDHFEEEIHKFAFAPESGPILPIRPHLAGDLSWTCYLRLLILQQRTSKPGHTVPDLEHTLELLIGSFDPPTRDLWHHRLTANR